MRKGTRCDNCEEVIEYYGTVLFLGSGVYNFCDNCCMDEWAREHSHAEEVEDDENEWPRD